MTFIQNFQKFILNESAMDLPEVIEFKDAFDNSEWGKILSRKATIDPKKTGRIYLKAPYLPSRTQIEKRGGNWVYWYTSAGRDYGHKYMATPDLLIRELVYDSLRKGNSSIPRNELDKFLKNHDDSLKALSDPRVTIGYPREDEISAYQAIRDYGAEETGIVTDLSGISTPYLEFLKQEGFIIDRIGRSLVISFRDLSIIAGEDQQGLPPFFKDIKTILEKSGLGPIFGNQINRLKFRFKKYGNGEIKITASGEGTVLQKGTRVDILTLGYADEKSLEKEIDSVLKNHISSCLILSKVGDYRSDQNSREKAIDIIKGETKRFFKDGSSINISEEESRYLIARLRLINRII